MTATHTRTLQPGDPVVARLSMPGPEGLHACTYAGSLRGFVLNAGAEVDVIINPAEYSTPERDEDMRIVLYDCGIEDEDWIREGPVMILRNMQLFDVRHEDDPTYPAREARA